MLKVIMRKARRSDVASMNRIFNDCMDIDGNCLDIDHKDESYWLEWFAAHDRKHPVYVGELDSRVICWAALNRYSNEYAYNGVAELSLHLDPKVNIAGMQESLLRFLEGQAQELGFYKLLASVFLTNRSALHIFRSAGYRDVGTFRNHGFYKGSLVDVICMERLLPVDMEALKQSYRDAYPFYEQFFAREEAIQEYQMLRNGMVRSAEDPNRWVPVTKEDPPEISEDWGGATVRRVGNLPSMEEIIEQRLAEKNRTDRLSDAIDRH